MVASVIVSGCGVGAASSPSDAAGALARFYAQRPTWTPCGDQLCATASVPLDYADPGGARLTLSLVKHPATSTPRLGTLFVSPGGPGAGASTMGPWFDTTGLGGFDVVGWDPRGVDASAAVVCADASATDRLRALDASPDTPDEASALVAASKEYAAACATHSPSGLLAHVSTADSARDLDILRAAVGDERLSFYAASYSTLLAAAYADLFPARIGRLVLDSPVDVTGTSTVPQAAGLDAALRSFAAGCVTDGGCPWGDDPAAAFDALASWLRGLDAAPVAGGDRPLSQSLAASGVAGLLDAGRPGWPALAGALAAARAGDGRALLAASDALAGRRPDGRYGTLLPAGTAIWCADHAHPGVARAQAAWAADRASAPLFGYLLGPDVTCVDWPVPASVPSVSRASGLPGSLIIGATRDPATPYAWATATAGALASSVLLTYDGDGHVSYGRSPCVDAAVRRYLTSGQLPPAGTTCSD